MKRKAHKAVDPRNDQAMADLMEQVLRALEPVAARCPAFGSPQQCKPITDLVDQVKATSKELKRRVEHPEPAPSCPWTPPEASPEPPARTKETPTTDAPSAEVTPSPRASAPSPAPANQPAPPPAPCPCRGQASPNADDVPNAGTTAEPTDAESKP